MECDSLWFSCIGHVILVTRSPTGPFSCHKIWGKGGGFLICLFIWQLWDVVIVFVQHPNYYFNRIKFSCFCLAWNLMRSSVCNGSSSPRTLQHFPMLGRFLVKFVALHRAYVVVGLTICFITHTTNVQSRPTMPCTSCFREIYPKIDQCFKHTCQ